MVDQRKGIELFDTLIIIIIIMLPSIQSALFAF